MDSESAKPKASESVKKTSSEKPAWSERKRLEKAIGDFLKKASQYKEVLEDALYTWITTSGESRELLEKLTMHKTEKLRRQLENPSEVILFLHNDGWLEVYGMKTTRVHAYTMPWWDVPASLAQEVVEIGMPERLARAMWPNGLKDQPGLIDTFQVTQVPVTRESGVQDLYTWKTCENQWDLKAINQSQDTNGKSTEAKSPSDR